MMRFSPTCSKSFRLGNVHPTPAIDLPAAATQLESDHQRRWRLWFRSSGSTRSKNQAPPLSLVALSETLAVNLAAKFDRWVERKQITVLSWISQKPARGTRLCARGPLQH